MTPTKPRDLLAVVLVVGIVANVLVQLTYGALPAFPLLAGATFGVLAIAEAIAAYAFRARIRREPGTRPVQPLVAARAVLVAKASSAAGAVVSGGWLGLLVYVAPRAGGIVAAAEDTASAAVGLVCAMALVGAALWLEHSLRAPDDPEDAPRPAP
ncbi:MAG: DUF3180 domain-containing protein [Pseudonocardia sp.]|nr:DUF3180 domain-containing protein [Pseudonocardia sp.]